MVKGPFINLPVKDVAASRAFFTGLGFAINEKFLSEHAVAVTLNEQSAAMLLARDFFTTFTPRAISDAHSATEVLVALGLESRPAVDAMADKALASGGGFVREPQDLGFMYSRVFADPDGHVWEPFWMKEGEQK